MAAVSCLVCLMVCESQPLLKGHQATRNRAVAVLTIQLNYQKHLMRHGCVANFTFSASRDFTRNMGQQLLMKIKLNYYSIKVSFPYCYDWEKVSGEQRLTFIRCPEFMADMNFPFVIVLFHPSANMISKWRSNMAFNISSARGTSPMV